MNKHQLKDIEVMITKIMDVYVEIVSLFDCSKCGTCCENSPNLLFSDEYINFDKDIIYKIDGLYGLVNPCPFLIDNICKIHNTVKPRICRFSPFIIGNGIDQILLKDCDLGKKIFIEYNNFIKNTNVDICDMINPFSNIELMISFLDWLKEKNLMKNNEKN